MYIYITVYINLQIHIYISLYIYYTHWCAVNTNMVIDIMIKYSSAGLHTHNGTIAYIMPIIYRLH